MADTINPKDYFFNPNDVIWQSSNYYKRDTNGNIRVWCVWVSKVPGMMDPENIVGGGDRLFIQSAQGVIGGTISLHQATTIADARSKSTLKEQAIFDATSKVNDKVKGGYLDDMEKAQTYVRVRPMGANHFKDRGHNITFPAAIQRKYDGVRVLIRKDGNKVTLTSRGGETYNGFTKIENAVKRMNLPDGFVLDGELYAHGKALQSIGGIARKGMSESWNKMTDKQKEAASEKKNELYVRVYDGINTKDLDENFFTRYNKAMKIIKGNPYLKKVETYIVADSDDGWERQSQFIDEGYEGAMIRNLKSPYKFGPSKSNDLLKLKNFEDSEFKIVGAWDAGGGHSGAIMWVCETTDDDGNKVEFNVTPMGTIDSRRALYEKYKKDPTQFIGKDMTVRYMGLNPKTNIPNIAKGVAIRDYE